jgi:hypothetical protein
MESRFKPRVHYQKRRWDMSKEAVQAVIGKAVTEGEFRELLFANPDEALEGYELTDAELEALKSVDAETMESFAGALDERISKAFIIEGYVAGPKADATPQHLPEDF